MAIKRCPNGHSLDPSWSTCPYCERSIQSPQTDIGKDSAPLNQSPQNIDRSIGGRYILKESLGSGGMGQVWKAHHTLLDQTVAVKILHYKFGQNREVAERFLREARLQARLRHPNIVQVYDCLVEEDQV